MEIDCGNISENIQQWKIIRMELNEYKKNSKQEMYDVQKTKMIKEEEQSLAQEWLNEDKLATDNLEIKLRRTEETISLMNTESTREVKELELEAESLHQQIMEAKKKDNVSLHHLQNSLEETKSNLESTKAYGKNRMRSGYELLVKVCHSSVDDLDTGMELVVNMKHCVQKCCDGLLEVAKAATANALRINISQTYQL
ncbi:hypothetical protein SK128_013176 [Halocaridina rubra]|uniref:Uncharacterized protein n=1 Tax=Halocaridina rubra TaxID=373956 RepID=A0AAN8ZUM9_HALRR